MTLILKRRTAADVTQSELGHVIARSAMWVSLVERGQIEISAETEKKILAAIEKLADHKREVRRLREALSEEMRLPRVCA